MTRHVYGPVPSRRLGRSLGVDLVPFKTCSYDCVYCQLGRTTHLTIERREYLPVGEMVADLETLLARGGPRPDWISLAGSGEPTLNAGIGELLRAIKRRTDIPVAVLTNGSLLWRSDLRQELMAADLVLPSLDAGSPSRFQLVNRPDPAILFDSMVEGLAAFTREFRGEVWLEVFLLAEVADLPEEVGNLAEQIRRIGPARVQLNTVARPPAEKSAVALSSGGLLAVRDRLPGRVEIIAGSESIPAVETGEAGVGVGAGAGEAAVLDLISRRPCTPHDVARGLGIHDNEAVKHLGRLVASGQARTLVTNGVLFYAEVGLLATGPAGHPAAGDAGSGSGAGIADPEERTRRNP